MEIHSSPSLKVKWGQIPEKSLMLSSKLIGEKFTNITMTKKNPKWMIIYFMSVF